MWAFALLALVGEAAAEPELTEGPDIAVQADGSEPAPDSDAPDDPNVEPAEEPAPADEAPAPAPETLPEPEPPAAEAPPEPTLNDLPDHLFAGPAGRQRLGAIPRKQRVSMLGIGVRAGAGSNPYTAQPRVVLSYKGQVRPGVLVSLEAQFQPPIVRTTALGLRSGLELLLPKAEANKGAFVAGHWGLEWHFPTDIWSPRAASYRRAPDLFAMPLSVTVGGRLPLGDRWTLTPDVQLEVQPVLGEGYCVRNSPSTPGLWLCRMGDTFYVDSSAPWRYWSTAASMSIKGGVSISRRF